MKILFVHERFGAWGGAEANLLLTGRELKRRGHEVGLLHGPATGRLEREWREVFTSHPLPAKGTPEILEALFHKFAPDLFYVHKMGDLAVLEALAAAEQPVVRMVHDHDLYCMRSYKYSPLSRRVCTRGFSPFCVFPCGASLARNSSSLWPVRWVSYIGKKEELRLNRRFSRLVVASHYMKEELLRNGFEEEQIRICPPVPQGLKMGASSSFSDKNLVIYAGQIIRGKGVDVLLEALAQVEVPFQCLLFGDGNYLPACRELAHKLGLQDRVHFKGFVSQEELGAYYSQATLGVVSSVWPEPFGAVGLEALSYGLPVVAFDVGGIRDWLISAYNGFLVPWMDRDGFAARVQQLLIDKSLARQMGQRGQRLVQKKFDFPHYVSSLESLFETVRAESKERVLA